SSCRSTRSSSPRSTTPSSSRDRSGRRRCSASSWPRHCSARAPRWPSSPRRPSSPPARVRDPAVIRAGDVERRRLNELFVELCRIDSPSRSERLCADRVAAELRALGLEVEEDDAGSELGGNCGTLFARIAAAPDAERSILLCAHLDTVPALEPIEPQLTDGAWEN